jgi:hypothetical protein
MIEVEHTVFWVVMTLLPFGITALVLLNRFER